MHDREKRRDGERLALGSLTKAREASDPKKADIHPTVFQRFSDRVPNVGLPLAALAES